MNIDEQLKLRFLGVDIVQLNFQSQKPLEGDIKLDLEINPKVFYPKDAPHVFKIICELKLGARDFFSLDLTAIGSFVLSKEVQEDTKREFVNVNAPAIMFPYIRSFISSFTSNLGTVTGGSIILPPQFFDGELEDVLSAEDESQS